MGAGGIKVQADAGGIDMYSELGTNNESVPQIRSSPY